MIDLTLYLVIYLEWGGGGGEVPGNNVNEGNTVPIHNIVISTTVVS